LPIIPLVTWQSPEVLFNASAVGAAAGFVVGRWWSIPTIVVGWLIYVFLIDGRLAPKGLEGHLDAILSNLVLVNVFATTWLVGIATAMGFAVRFAIRRRAQGVLNRGAVRAEARGDRRQPPGGS
jgi:hypothetical protein